MVMEVADDQMDVQRVELLGQRGGGVAEEIRR